jgi:FimV-like protein
MMTMTLAFKIVYMISLFIVAAAIVFTISSLYRRWLRSLSHLDNINQENKPSALTKKNTSFTISSHDINAIAGDDVIATQLDLARAYIETGRKQLAKKILIYVLTQGTVNQQQEAQRLLGFI